MHSTWILWIIILVSSLPIVAVYVWYRLAKYQFSRLEFFIILLVGAAAFFPAVLLQGLLNFSIPSGRAALFYHFFIRIAFTEEFSRLLVLLVFLWISLRIKPIEGSGSSVSYDMIKKGTATGLVAGIGFAILESAVYAASSDVSVLLLRVVTAALHGACGSRVGAAAVLLRTNPMQALLRVITATAIHGIYNIMVTLPGFPAIAAVVIAVSAFATAVITIHSGGRVEENAKTTNGDNFPAKP